MQKIRKEEKMKKFIITVVGRDTVGIIAKVCTYLAGIQVNILDISQTIVDVRGTGCPWERDRRKDSLPARRYF